MRYTAPPSFTTRPTLRGSFGMAASTHWLASQSAMAVLERGGNAFDAAVAGALVLQVVEPHLNGPGGDLVALIAPEGQPTRVLCGQGPAPAEATIDHYRGLGLGLVPGSGLLAATVPGAFDALLLLLRDHGSWELADAAEFALHYARTGYPVVPPMARSISAVADLFTEHWTTSSDHWLENGEPPTIGSMRPAEKWAETLTRLIEAGTGETREDRIESVRREWAEGFVAAEIDAIVREPAMDSSGEAHAGVLRSSDIAGWRATFEEPVRAEFRGHTIVKAGAWTQGPTLLQALGILGGHDDRALDPSTAWGVHLVIESAKLAMADREAYYGDTDVPLDRLLSTEYLAARRKQIRELASGDLRPGALDGRAPRLPRDSVRSDSHRVAGTGEPAVASSGATSGDTCHIDVVDQWGNMVSATPSGGWLQSSPYIPALGFSLGTRLQMTWLEEGLPSSLTPGKRPRSTLSPTIIERDGRAIMAAGTPGGDQQDQWQIPFILRMLVGGYELQQAIDAPTFHTTSVTESFWPRQRVPYGAEAESRIGREILAELVVRGHELTIGGKWSLGRLSAVLRNDDGTLSAGANPRGAQGYAVGR